MPKKRDRIGPIQAYLLEILAENQAGLTTSELVRLVYETEYKSHSRRGNIHQSLTKLIRKGLVVQEKRENLNYWFFKK